MGISNFLVIDGSSPLSFNAFNHSTRAKIAFYISLENKLDIDNDSDMISSDTGGGVTAGDASTSTTLDLRIASLLKLL